MLSDSKLQSIICRSRIDEAERFYSDTLGLRSKGKSHGALVYDFGGSILRVSPVPSAQPLAHTVRDPDGNLLSVVEFLSD